jgi:hypothetical protein
MNKPGTQRPGEAKRIPDCDHELPYSNPVRVCGLSRLKVQTGRNSGHLKQRQVPPRIAFAQIRRESLSVPKLHFQPSPVLPFHNVRVRHNEPAAIPQYSRTRGIRADPNKNG